jgi:hypothetical protein
MPSLPIAKHSSYIQKPNSEARAWTQPRPLKQPRRSQYMFNRALQGGDYTPTPRMHPIVSRFRTVLWGTNLEVKRAREVAPFKFKVFTTNKNLSGIGPGPRRRGFGHQGPLTQGQNLAYLGCRPPLGTNGCPPPSPLRTSGEIHNTSQKI